MGSEGKLSKGNQPIYVPDTTTASIDLMPVPLDQINILQAMETSMSHPTNLSGLQSSLNLQANTSMLDILGTASQQGPNSVVSDLSFQDSDFLFNMTYAEAYGNWEGL